MTCIIGKVENDRVFIGGDRASVGDSHYLNQYDVPKVFEVGDFIFGYTSSFRMGQVLEFVFQPPKITGEDIRAYMIKDFVPALRQCMKDEGVARIKENEEYLGTFLVGVRGKLFLIDDDFGVHPHDNFIACGSGVSVAHGAMHVAVEAGYEAEDAILLALEAASQFVTTVREPFDIVRTQ